jgi:drug/metabolite transporter (DMT)-like permease
LSPRLKGTLCACTCVCIWTGFILISRYGTKTSLRSVDLAALRFLVAGIILLPVFLKRRFDGLSVSQVAALVVSGGLAYALLAYSGFMFAPAAHGAILSPGALPFFTAFAVWLLLDERPNAARWTSLTLIALGIALVGWHSFFGATASPTTWIGDLLFLASAASWSIFSTLARKWNVRPLTNTALVSCMSAFVYLPIYFLLLPSAIGTAPLSDVMTQAIYQGVFAVAIATVCYGTAIATIGPSSTSAIIAAVPVSASLLAVPLLGEPLVGNTVAGLLAVTLGILVGTGLLRVPRLALKR